MAKTFPQDDDWSDNDANYTYIFEDWIDFDWNDIVVNVHASTTDGILSDLALAFREAAWMNPLSLEITAIGTWIRIQWNTTECEEVQFLTLGNGETRTIALFAESDLCDIAHLRFLIPPQANFTWHPEKPFVGETVVFDASSSIDYDDGIRFYSWVFDGEVSIYGENMTVSYKFRSPGNHSIKFAAVDWSGLEDCIRRELEVLAVVGGASGALDYALRTAWEYVNLLLLLTFLIAANLKRIK